MIITLSADRKTFAELAKEFGLKPDMIPKVSEFKVRRRCRLEG